MVKTKFDRIDAGIPGVAAFRIEGKLGFHENAKIQRLVEECMKREFRAVIVDFSELSSLGGGVAKILREFNEAIEARGGRVNFVVTNDIIAQFLQDGAKPVFLYRSFAEALAASRDAAPSEKPATTASPDAPPDDSKRGVGQPESGVICMPYETADAVEAPADQARAGISALAAERGGDAAGIIGEIFGGAGDAPGTAAAVPDARKTREREARAGSDAAVADLNRQLKRRILELRTLFSISSDFNAIRDRKKLLDIFLLTSIAEGGVESAAFLEHQGTCFSPIMSKGIDAEALARLELPAGACAVAAGENNVFPLDAFPLEPSWREAIKGEGIEYACPFRTKDGLAGIVLLGKRIAGRGMKQEDFEFLRILLNVAQGAYDNALMFEREHERTLGIVKTLISIIEDNTLLKGTSELVSRYVGMTAKSMDYPEEHFKDLIYGTVLRDMGMVRVSDLILRSPRDLSKEEWEIIKRHPEDGGEMLDRMKFGDHAVSIVRTHHERFNGEGYPYCLRGKEIPLGARIISVVESYAAMIHERPTRPALSEREALDTLKENYGLRYDREVVMHFSRIMEKEIAQSVQTGTAAALQGR
jgi:HD-GYP domain-containing protein (c-di-GMP phosphodiesterase class II)/anti-anti-sigma regulatory factor